MGPWICPRCGTVWAGWVAKCDCRVTVSASTCKHQNIVYDTAGTRCLDCGYVFPMYTTIIES